MYVCAVDEYSGLTVLASFDVCILRQWAVKFQGKITSHP